MNTLKKNLLITLFSTVICVNALGAVPKSNYLPKTPAPIRHYLSQAKPLNNKALFRLVNGNSMIGTTANTRSVYELYFRTDGTLIFRKSRNPKNVHFGRWWIKNDNIHSQWTTYRKKPSVNKLKYYRLLGNIYIPFNVNKACGPANYYCHPFMLLPGDTFQLDPKNRKR